MISYQARHQGGGGGGLWSGCRSNPRFGGNYTFCHVIFLNLKFWTTLGSRLHSHVAGTPFAKSGDGLGYVAYILIGWFCVLFQQRHEMLAQCRLNHVNTRPASQAVDKHQTSSGSTSCVWRWEHPKLARHQNKKCKQTRDDGSKFLNVGLASQTLAQH